MPVEKTARFARTPENVLLDPFLSHLEVRIYGIMALHCIGTNILMMGQRKLAQLAHVDRRNLSRYLDKLAARGHISRAIGRISRRTVYQLNSSVFLSTVKDEGRSIFSRMGVVDTPSVDVLDTPRFRIEKRRAGKPN